MTSFDDRMQALRQRFVAQTLAETELIEACLGTATWQKIRDLSHGIAGRAGMFGFPELTVAARMVEVAIDQGDHPGRLRLLVETLISKVRDMEPNQ